MSVRIIIKIFLTLQLLLLIFRQMIDFAGIQWLMIMVNAVAIIITITGFFGYLVFYASFQVFLIVYNIYVICVYARFITVGDRNFINDGVLSFDKDPQHKDPHHPHPSAFGTMDGVQSDVFEDVVAHTSLLPSAQLLSFDMNSRSFWYVIVSNHISNIQSHLSHYPLRTTTTSPQSHHQPMIGKNNLRHPFDESLVDICVQYIEIAIASLHILFSLLAIALILLKHKLERDKFFRNNDKTTPPLPPYTINPQMNHYMSFTPTSFTTNKSSIYTQNNNSVRRSSKRRRSTRSLHIQKSKSNSMGALNSIRANSSGSLRSMSKHGHRKSATSLLMMNNNNNNIDTSFSNNTNCGSMRSNSGLNNNNNSNNSYLYQTNNNLYGTIVSNTPNKPAVPIRQSQYRSPIKNQQRHSTYGMVGGSIGGPSSLTVAQRVAKFVNSDSETDNYYHTFTPAYLNNGLANPLYGKRNSYLDSSETAI